MVQPQEMKPSVLIAALVVVATQLLQTDGMTAANDLRAAIMECLKLSSDCSKGPHGPIGSWDVSAVTDMSQLFNHDFVSGTNKFTGDISNWDVSGVTDMGYMFHKASLFNADISKWDVVRVAKMEGMFASAPSFNGVISEWDVSKVIYAFHLWLNSCSKIL